MKKKRKQKWENFDKDSFNVVARHFAEDMGVRVIFKKGVAPHVKDNDTIVLPDNIRFVTAEDVSITLWHLLRTCKCLKKSTWEETTKSNTLTQAALLCLRSLEELRINDLIFKDYPHSKDFCEMATEEIVADFKKTPTDGTAYGEQRKSAMRRLLSFLLEYQGLSYLYSDKEAKKFWRKRKNAQAKIEIYEDVKLAKRTPQLVFPARKLADILFPDDPHGIPNSFQEQLVCGIARLGTLPCPVEEQHFDVELSPSGAIERELIRLLRSTHQREVQKDEGRILAQNLPYYHDDEKLFVDDIMITEEKSQLSFLIDCSGSMGGTPLKIACTSLLNILKALNKFAVKEGMVEFNAMAFADRTGWLKSFKQKYDGDSVHKGYEKAAGTLGGGTDPVPAVKKALGEFQSDARRKIIFLITDGVLERRDYIWLEDNVPPDVLLIFLRIGGRVDNENWLRAQDHTVWKKFSAYSVEDANDLTRALKEQITKALKGE